MYAGRRALVRPSARTEVRPIARAPAGVDSVDHRPCRRSAHAVRPPRACASLHTHPRATIPAPPTARQVVDRAASTVTVPTRFPRSKAYSAAPASHARCALARRGCLSHPRARLTARARAAPPSQVTLLREPSSARRWMAIIQHLQSRQVRSLPHRRACARHRRARRSELNPPCPIGALYLPCARV
jgi:hypothetical protein